MDGQHIDLYTFGLSIYSDDAEGICALGTRTVQRHQDDPQLVLAMYARARYGDGRRLDAQGGVALQQAALDSSGVLSFADPVTFDLDAGKR